MSSYYTKQGYAMLAENNPSAHYFGGKPYHDGATCPICEIPLLLLADLDCVELRKLEKAKLFSNLDRLPFYYCWRCCAEKLSYQVNSHSIKIFKNEGESQGDDFPYPEFPDSFEKRPLSLSSVPYETAKLLAVGQEVDSYWLEKNDLLTIQNELDKLRHAWFSKSSFDRHQIGGLLNLAQGHEYIVCPNPHCEYHKLAQAGRATRMKELAVIHNDPHSSLPMCESLGELKKPTDFNEYIQVVYWVCEECLTIAASNRCD